mmetsp:Transcript_9877/g.12502  ORF Transcript_9877/g.12502 Transcript_9877/m.12502 type:complete len:926 (+) Transcript_9877:152-2929(+)
MKATTQDEIEKQHKAACDKIKSKKYVSAPMIERGEIPLAWKQRPTVEDPNYDIYLSDNSDDNSDDDDNNNNNNNSIHHYPSAETYLKATITATDFLTMIRCSFCHDIFKKEIKLLSSRFLSTTTIQSPLLVSKNHPTHLIFGANTDVGKTVVSTSLVKSNIHNNKIVNYVKPLQSGGGDESFIDKHVKGMENTMNCFEGHTLFRWDTPASPHLASRKENKPASDDQVLSKLKMNINDIHNKYEDGSVIFIETAGGVLSPSCASPLNTRPRHASGSSQNETTGDITDNWGWSTQGDLYQPLHLPVILVGDGRLGGISATLSALESLLTRGYDVNAIALIEDSADTSGHGSNLPALKEYASRCLALRSGSGRALLSDVENCIVSFPSVPADINIPLDDWFKSEEVIETSARLSEHLVRQWGDHIDTLGGMRDKGTKVLWWPFTQHQGHNDKNKSATLIDGASGDNFSILTDGVNNMERTDHFDACASWWTQGLGHGESSIGLAAAAAAGRYGHVIFPDVVHEPATTLADRLVNSDSGPGKGWASRVFFTDDGSTAVEVAIKMGMKKFAKDHNINIANNDVVLTVCAQKDCYHGDTLGVMDVAEPSIFNEGQHPWYEPKGLFLDYPTVRYKDGSVGITFPSEDNDHGLTSVKDMFDVGKRISSNLYNEYFDSIENEWNLYEAKQESRLIGSLLIEPILLGAGGMKFIDPLWQRALIEVARSKNVPVIFDEVASGLYRLGVRSCREILLVDPDIAAYAKLLTGGLIPMSVTLATEEVFQTFLGDSKAEALLHGHSYTAHPVGCVSSIHALDAYDALFRGQQKKSNDRSIMPSMVEYFDQVEVAELSKLDLVQEAMAVGTVLAVTIKPDRSGSGYAAAGKSIPIVKKLFESGVYARPLGNVVYIMVSPLTSREECSRLSQILRHAIESID